METKTFLVEGMLCKNCKIHVEDAIRNITSIRNVIADTNNGQVRVEGEEINSDRIRDVIQETGYIFKGELTNVPHISDQWIG